MKRLLPILLSAAIAVTGTAVPVSAVDTSITETETALSWLLQDGCLEVWGEGDMPNYDKEDNPHPFSDQNREVTSLKIEEGVTSIGEYAFCGCKSLTSINIPDSVLFVMDSLARVRDSLFLARVDSLAAACARLDSIATAKADSLSRKTTEINQ